jgi:hypothetical protein
MHAPAKASYSSLTSSECNGYFISPEDPAVVAVELEASGAKLMSGNVIGSLQFESQDREHEFLSQAGASFCSPLMEKELMKSGMPNMLECAQDLALKSFVATWCAT